MPLHVLANMWIDNTPQETVTRGMTDSQVAHMMWRSLAQTIGWVEVRVTRCPPPMCVCPVYPRISFICEELCAYATKGFSEIAVGVYEAIRARSFVPLCVHVVFGLLPWYMRLPVHFYWNQVTRVPKNKSYLCTAFAPYPHVVRPQVRENVTITFPKLVFIGATKPEEQRAMLYHTTPIDHVQRADQLELVSLFGPYCPNRLVAMPANDPDALEHALQVRVLAVNHEASLKTYLPLLDHELKWLRLLQTTYKPINVRAWMDAQKPAVQRKLHYIHQQGVQITARINQRNIFGKTNEKFINIRNGVFEPKPMRVISAATDEANYILGPLVRSYQHTIFGSTIAWLQHEGEEPLFYCTCAMNLSQIGAMFHRFEIDGYTHYWCIDKSKFDRFYSTYSHEFEAACFNVIHPMTDAQRYVFEGQIDRKCKSACGLEFRLVGNRNSGDPNTTVGNTVVCGLTAVRSLLAAGLTMKDFRVVAAGDDMLIVFQQRRHYADVGLIEHFKQHQLATFGFVNKLFLATSIFDVDFLSCRVVPAQVNDLETYVLQPTLKAFVKMFWTDSQIALTRGEEFLGVVLEAFKHMYAADPYVLVFLNALSRFAKDAKKPIEMPVNGIMYMLKHYAKGDFGKVMPSSHFEAACLARYGSDAYTDMMNANIRAAENASTRIFPISVNTIALERDLEGPP